MGYQLMPPPTSPSHTDTHELRLSLEAFQSQHFMKIKMSRLPSTEAYRRLKLLSFVVLSRLFVFVVNGLGSLE